MLCNAYRRRGRPLAELLRAFDYFRRLPIQYSEESSDSVDQAATLAMTFHKSFHDMCYFALGEEQSVPVCTADEKSVGGLGSEFPVRFVLLHDMFTSG